MVQASKFAQKITKALNDNYKLLVEKKIKLNQELVVAIEDKLTVLSGEKLIKYYKSL